METQRHSSNSDIKALLLVFGAAILTAVLLAALMLYNYGPSGRYSVKNILLSPKTLQTLRYEDNRGHGKLVFNASIFSFYDESQKMLKQIKLDADQYSRIYALIESDESLEVENEKLFDKFSSFKLAKLAIEVRAEGSEKAMTRQFQIVEFSSDGDYYRVQLRDDQLETSYAYFYHRGILKNIFSIL